MNLRKYLKVYKKFLHTSLASELEYKTNILVDLITAILSLVGSIFLLSIFFQNNGYIGGWKFEQALIIQAIYTILNGITNTWFNPNLTEIVKHIREGTLDFVLLKPIDSQFFISLKKINPSGFLEIMLGFFLLLYCIRINQINLNLSFLTLSLIILVDLITAILSLVGSIFLLSIFFQNNGYIGGWKFEQALIIQAIYTILNGITNTWFNPNLTEIVKHIREGTLDFVLLKPIDSQFFISLKKINPSGFLEIMLGFFLLLFCIRINQINLNLSFLTLSLITISCSICILYSLWFFISTTTIWFVKTWNAIEVLRSFLYIGRFPLNSFSFSLRIFFSVFIPIAFITTIPSEVFLGLSELWKILLEVIVATVFLITSRKFWLYALKFYSSASS